MPLGAFRLNTLGATTTPPVVILNRYNNAITSTGDMVISTANPKFGTGAASITSSGTVLSTIPFNSIPDNSDWTVEGWAFYNGSVFSGYRGLVGMPSGGINLRGFGGDGGVIEYYIVDKNGANAVNWNGVTPAYTAGYFHWAVVHANDTFLIYTNGVNRSARGGYSANYNLFGTSTTDNNLAIGGEFTGFQDEIRISKSARYLSNFTPPAAPFVNDANTIALYHMNGVNNTTEFTDDNTPPGSVTSVSFVAQATSTAATITIPATAQVGDIAFLFDTSTSSTNTIPANWTLINRATLAAGQHTNISRKEILPGEAGTSITGLAITSRKVLLVYRPNVIGNPLSITVTGSQATTAAPTNQTLTGEAGPMIAFAVYAKSTSSTPTRGWSVGSPTEYSSVSTSGIYVKALITNSGTPSTTTISMTDAGSNTLQSFRVKF
jgi:hypothetical protein